MNVSFTAQKELNNQSVGINLLYIQHQKDSCIVEFKQRIFLSYR